jgi:hypothetical protein
MELPFVPSVLIITIIALVVIFRNHPDSHLLTTILAPVAVVLATFMIYPAAIITPP